MANLEDIIFLKTDPTFLLPLNALNELHSQRRFGFQTVVSSQEAEIVNVKSQAEEEQHQFIFGGNHKENEVISRQCFARTFSTAARMCMVKATNMHMHPWMNNPAYRRNKNSIRYQQSSGQSFRLADVHNQVRYTSKYDQLYPHFLIEEKLADVDVGHLANLSSFMLIFRNNFTEVIEIITTANATCLLNNEPGMFHSRIHVLCMHRKIQPGNDLENMVLLKRFCGDPGTAVQRHLNAITLTLEGLNVDRQCEDDETDDDD